MKNYPRRLTEGEIALLEDVFGNGLNYGDVRIDIGGIAKTEDNGATARTHYDTMSFPEPPDDFSREKLRTRAWLIHEAVHVWQWQQYGIDTYENGSRLWMSRGGHYSKAYEWSMSDKFSDMNIEQQARAVEDRYLVSHDLTPRDETDWQEGQPLPSLSSYDKLLQPFDAQNDKGTPPHRKIPNGWDRDEGGGLSEEIPSSDLGTDIEEEREQLRQRLQELLSIIETIDEEGLAADVDVIDRFLGDLNAQLDSLDSLDGADLLDRLRSLMSSLNEWRDYLQNQLDTSEPAGTGDFWMDEDDDSPGSPVGDSWEEEEEEDRWARPSDPEPEPDPEEEDRG